MLKRRQIRAIKRAFRKLFQRTWKFATTVTKNVFDWFLRTELLISSKQRQTHAKAGFVLPTVALLLVVVSLVVGAILFRTGSRTNQVIAERNQQAISNFATPSIDRAKAKIEYLFAKDTRLSNNGITAESQLLHMMLNDGLEVDKLEKNPYLLPDETQIDINGDGKKDTAWMYPIDINNDGQPETQAAYSITMKSQHPENVPSSQATVKRVDDTKKKADNLVVRNGPIIAEFKVRPECQKIQANQKNLNTKAPETGWDQFNTSLLKTFQVTAVVAQKKGNGGRAVVTQEYQQDRELTRNPSIWFRDDLHISPGTKLNWNGAMHTEGSLFVNPLWQDNDFTAYLISAPESCVYDPSSGSDITVTRLKDVQGMDEDYAFYGQVVSGDIINDKLVTIPTKYSSFHIHGRPPKYTDDDVKIDISRDSTTGGKPSDIALDPVKIFTEDISQARGLDKTNVSISTEKWKDEAALSPRIRALSKNPPYIDDTYRADDRLGPKPKYRFGEGIDPVTLDSTNYNGRNINETGLTNTQKPLLIAKTTSETDKDFRELGLDGYWERRARIEGMRIIGGPRLELGNLYGWQGANYLPKDQDPLYPLYKSGLVGTISHEQQQRRTLRDNLAAVQATAVFHKAVNPDIAAACVSTTSHPGTNFPVLTSIQQVKDEVIRYSDPGEPEGTIQQSTDFREAGKAGEKLLRTNFFTGKGTNGWEYEPNWTKLNDLNSGDWGKALKNLANFAGEIDGAFPPTKQDRVYPHPYLSMWGNFSNLRRALEKYNGSIADDSYKQTAACTLGMLATNMEDLRIKADKVSTANLNDRVDKKLTALDGTAVPANPDLFAAITDAGDREKARQYSLWLQIERDRKLGFAPVPAPTIVSNPTPTAPIVSATYDKYQFKIPANTATPPFEFDFAGKTYNENEIISLGCDYKSAFADGGANYFGLSNKPADWSDPDKKKFIRLAVTLCSATNEPQPVLPKFPALYYLFPTTSHARNTNQPPTEPYIQQTTTISTTGNFEPVVLDKIALKPKNDITDFKLPTNTSKGDRVNPLKIKRPNNSDGFVSLLDAGVFNGREMMSVRTLDIDLNLLKNESIGTDRWLPSSGIVYAFREDAIREDAISRPSRGDYTKVDNIEIKNRATNATNTNDPRDPTIKDNGISPKAVDFIPDPDRRPYGFRLKNGKDLSRPDSGDYRLRGLTLISDNPVYIQGDFNVHKVEEFNQPLGYKIFDPNEFYSRSSLNSIFGTAGDSWRPTEILTDAITLLSQDFRDGDVASGLYGVKDPEILKNSYRAQNITDDRNDYWVREDGSVANRSADPAPTKFPNKNIPIKIYRDGNPGSCGSTNTLTPCTSPSSVNLKVDLTSSTTGRSRKDKINTATKEGKEEGTEINAVLISGSVPARAQQGNGGLQNFPRFIENWKSSIPLKIQGAFFQLNFSTYATAPYEQDGWETDSQPLEPEYRWYYDPPTRVWGYDVGLQYVPAAPLSKRLDPSGKARSEFYEEPQADDPYICQLRKQVAGKGPESENIETVNKDCPQ